jgi:hypothetical protein
LHTGYPTAAISARFGGFNDSAVLYDPTDICIGKQPAAEGKQEHADAQ